MARTAVDWSSRMTRSTPFSHVVLSKGAAVEVRVVVDAEVVVELAAVELVLLAALNTGVVVGLITE